LSAVFGAELDLEATGEEAAEAIEELAKLFDSNFEIDDIPPS
jgi:phosphotransferase system HPr-like phosphotransfer protein